MDANAKVSLRKLMSRREFLLTQLAWGAAGIRQVALLMRISDGSIVSGSGDEAFTWVLPPGSTVKPFTLQALLDLHKLRADETYLCRGKFWVGEHNFTCSHPRGLPPMNLARAIAYSCNEAVAHFAQRFAPGEVASALRRAGFRVTAGNGILQALGEEGVLISPGELASAYRQLAQQGSAAILEGLEGAVQYGTAQAAALPHVAVAGKTGSAVSSTGLRAAWFAGFAPSRSPELVVVVATQGRSGGADSAPIAGELLRKHFEGSSFEATYRVRVGNRVINLPIEDYVAAVLAGESSVFKSAEALKAIAVAARTYAAHERGRHAKEGFDFCNTTHCQRAEPEGITPRFVTAAQGTAGEMLWFEGKLAFTPHTMSCGGIAESAKAV